MKTTRAERQARSQRLFVGIVFALYAAITLWVTLHHEPWRDEADSWLLLRDGGLGTAIARAGYSGSPALFYVVVAPLVKLGAPYLAQNLLNLLIAWAAVLLFLICAPFSRTIKALFVFSYYAAFEYAVVARPYALAMLLLFAIAAVWPRRRERPLPLAIFVALLAHTTTHTLFAAAAIGAVYLAEGLREKRRGLIVPAAIMMIAGAVAAWMVRTPADAGGVMGYTHKISAVWAFGNAFLPDTPFMFFVPFAVAMLAAVAYTIGRRWMVQAFLWANLLFLFAVYAFVWMGGLRHAGLVLLVVMFALWIAERPLHAAAEALLAIALLVSTFVAAGYWWNETTQPFSSAKQMAGYLREHHLETMPIAAHRLTAAEAVLPFLPKRTFYYPGMHADGSYMLWNRQYNTGVLMDHRSALADAVQHFAGRRWLLLVDTPIASPEQYGFRLLYKTDYPFEKQDEHYFLYDPSGAAQ
ncbi:MAG TPA: hypothetical protein VF824_11865 [Thermoanaerobaculia bacterium]|jgi:hypothetical protein